MAAPRGLQAVDPDSVLTPDERAWLKARGPLMVCTDPHWMPLERLNQDGTHEGIAADFLALVSRRGGFSYRIVPTRSWKESLEKARDRSCDMLSMASATPLRREFMDFTEPFLEVQTVVATLMHQPFIDGIEEIGNRKVGVIRGYSHVELLKQRNPSIEIVEIDDYHEGLMKVQDGALYGVVGNIASIGYSIQQEKMNNVKIAGRLEGDVMLSIASRNDQPELGRILNKLVQTLTETEKQEVMNRWLGVRYEHATDYTLLLRVVAIFAIIAAGIGVWLAKVRQLNQRLKEVNRRLEELNTQKDFYFSVIGHDLRNPFMSVVGYSDALRRDLENLSDAEISQMAGVIHLRATQVLDMLNQLLEWARLELRQARAEPAPVDLHMLTREVFALYEHAAQAKDVTLDMEVAPGSEHMLDPHMMSTILRNLVSNAIKYSPAGGTVKVLYSQNSGHLIVTDSGRGMDEQTVADLFSLKPRKSTPGTANEQGTGLGLTICQQYARQMGLSLQVKSEPGRGSQFLLKLA